MPREKRVPIKKPSPDLSLVSLEKYLSEKISRLNEILEKNEIVDLLEDSLDIVEKFIELYSLKANYEHTRIANLEANAVQIRNKLEELTDDDYSINVDDYEFTLEIVKFLIKYKSKLNPALKEKMTKKNNANKNNMRVNANGLANTSRNATTAKVSNNTKALENLIGKFQSIRIPH